jgi:hypothetical protein
VHTAGPKRVGILGGASIGDLMIFGEILAIKKDGIVSLVGLSKSPSHQRSKSLFEFSQFV